MNAVTLARVAVGLVEVAAPRRVGVTVLGHVPDRTERVVTRVLGARHLGQAVADERGSELWGGPALDVLHAASMLPVALTSRRYRRSALTSAAVATAFAIAAM